MWIVLNMFCHLAAVRLNLSTIVWQFDICTSSNRSNSSIICWFIKLYLSNPSNKCCDCCCLLLVFFCSLLLSFKISEFHHVSPQFHPQVSPRQGWQPGGMEAGHRWTVVERPAVSVPGWRWKHELTSSLKRYETHVLQKRSNFWKHQVSRHGPISTRILVWYLKTLIQSDRLKGVRVPICSYPDWRCLKMFEPCPKMSKVCIS